MSLYQRYNLPFTWRRLLLLHSNSEFRHNGKSVLRHQCCIHSFSKYHEKSLTSWSIYRVSTQERLKHHRPFSSCIRNKLIDDKAGYLYNRVKCNDSLYSKWRRMVSTDATVFSLRNSVMKDYLDSLVEEYRDVEQGLITGDRSKKKEYIKRKMQLAPIVEATEMLKTKYREMEELSDLQAEPEMKAMAEEELKTCLEDIEQQELELFELLTLDEKIDEYDIILEVTAGIGGQEAMLFALEVFNMYAGYAQYKGWQFTEIERQEGESGGVNSISASVSGRDVYRGLKFEGGVHRVQRIPKTETKGRTHTSTITVAILPQPTEIDIVLEKDDFKVEVMRSSGPGGQSVNTANSAVRLTHIPTGTVAKCQITRSQIKNKEIALKMIRSQLFEKQNESQISQLTRQRKLQVGSKGRSEKVRTYNFPQDRITDHRIKMNFHNLISFMAGGEALEIMTDELVKEAKTETLQITLDEFEASRNMKKSKVKR